MPAPTLPIIDCHHHVFDPARFPYAPESRYNPSGHELATPAYYRAVMQAYGIAHSLITQPTSGYNTDNRCLLDTIANGEGRHKGVAVLPWDTGLDALAALKAQGIVGMAFNVAMLGVEPFLHLDTLMGRLAEVGLFAQVQVMDDQLLALLPLLQRNPATMLVFDHSGRPDPGAGLQQPAFQALLALAARERVYVKLSGLAKFSRQPYPFADGHCYQRALLDAFGPERSMWGSDWPFLRATERMDIGTQLLLIEQLVDDAAALRQVMWETPRQLFGF